MLISFLRTIILYTILVVVIRMMGKRQLGEMEPMEFVVSMLIADLAAVPMQEAGIPLLSGLIPILVVLSIELILSVVTYHSVWLRRVFCGKPVILIQEGKLLQNNLKKTRVNTDELSEYLRIRGIVDISTIKYAILETGGSISTLLYPQYEPASAKNAGVHVPDLQLPITIISGGKLQKQNLKLLKQSPSWVDEQLRNYNCSVKDVYLLTAEPSGKLYLSIRTES